MAGTEAKNGIRLNRRSLLVAGGAGAGLLVAWAVWPRSYGVNLTAAPGETIFGAWLKIGENGQVTIAVPQAEAGQGVYTALPQIVAEELGADWRTVAVEAAPINPLYANTLAADVLFEDALGGIPDAIRRGHAERAAWMLTAGSTSIRMFEPELREAGAAARTLLCKAAAARWGVDWQACATSEGFVVHDDKRLRFAELAAEAAQESLPDLLPLRDTGAAAPEGAPLTRLDAPAKVDGSANFAGDIRLPNMVFAAIRQAPPGDARLVGVDRGAADGVRGVMHIVENARWVAAVADNWWAAEQALDALRPRFEVRDAPTSASIDAALTAALDGEGQRMANAGELAEHFSGAKVVTAEYRSGLALHAPLEPTTATAEWRAGRLSIWAPTQAPGLARSAAARALGIDETAVVVHAMQIGGSFGARLETRVIEQVAVLARKLERPVQLTWSRAEDCLHDRYRPAAAARMSARLASNGTVSGWFARIAAPQTGRELSRRLLSGDAAVALAQKLPGGGGDRTAVAGAEPIYGIPHYAVDHHPAAIGVPTGYWRSGAHAYTVFFTESFLDELAREANVEPLSFRIAMLGGQPRLARCLSAVASLGGWQGGLPGTAQGIAAHSFRGSHIALMAEARREGGRVVVDRLVAAVDCGRLINPDLVQQQIEGGLLYGMAAALGASTGFTDGLADVRNFRSMNLARLGSTPEISVELIRSDADPGGASEVAVPVVGPAIANALFAATGRRSRRLPLQEPTL